MKIQTQALLEDLQIDGQDIAVEDRQPIFLEFSAIDTGGGFKDPMLDFSVSVSSIEVQNHGESEVRLTVINPDDHNDEVALSYNGAITIADEEINGRITEEQLPKEMIRFIFKLFN
ncbi:hypothetical protein [Fodinibius sp. Rm-B-1B1-1]|uniref:hypothetical protein n=1 Tax=Fodinibius alkaliphilus TaxID=3140241 RepID=UPI00315A381D